MAKASEKEQGPPKPRERADVAADQLRAMKGEKDRSGLSAGLLILPVAAQIADAASTQAALKKGGREGNPAVAPVAGNAAAMYGIKVAIGLATDGVAEKLAKDGHRGLGKAVAILGAVLPAAAAVHNFSRK